MKFSKKMIAMCLSVMLFVVSALDSGAFALLGPVQPWMQSTNGVLEPGDIGGPMPLGCGYRWNVPVVTYGFDQSFLNYFGSNGVAAVESAIQTLNSLPPASQIVPTNFPYLARQINYEAQGQSLFDLKSCTLSLLLEQLGLASPTRNVYVLEQWNPILLSDGADGLFLGVFDGTEFTNYVAPMNYDPLALSPSPYVNRTLYFGEIMDFGSSFETVSYAESPLAPAYTAIADFSEAISKTDNLGVFYTGLTCDDVGGLCYLLSPNTINFETLLSGVVGTGTNSSSYANGAWRPGVDKITFIQQPVNSQSGAFLPATNCFTDRYITNGIVMQQQMKRIILQPDFVFSAGDVAPGSPAFPPLYVRTATTNWLNNATENGNSNGDGPGIIQPPIQMVFNKMGQQLYTYGPNSDVLAQNSSSFWGSFVGSTNAPIVYPLPQSSTNSSIVRMWLTFNGNLSQNYLWQPTGLSGAEFAMQTSTNLMNWATLFYVTNNGSVNTFINQDPVSPNRFYRLIPE